MEIRTGVKAKFISKVTTIAKENNCQRLKVYQLIEAGKLDHIQIDGSKFVYRNNKLKEAFK